MHLRSHSSSLAELEFAVKQAGPLACLACFLHAQDPCPHAHCVLPGLPGHSSVRYPGMALERKNRAHHEVPWPAWKAGRERLFPCWPLSMIKELLPSSEHLGFQCSWLFGKK